jgi:quinol-cytochrome oxidoreductase complex cytochrome b subunit
MATYKLLKHVLYVSVSFFFISHFFFFPRKAADQGHPHASYNLAIGHMKGYKTGLKPG